MKSLYLNFAVKSLLNRIRQYRSLFFVSAIGFCIMLSVLMVTDGMLDSMTEKLRQFYGGDFIVLGGKGINGGYALSDSQDLIEFIRGVVPNGTEVSYRSGITDCDKSLFFEGVGVKQRTIKGVVFENEKKLFEKFTFIEGNASQTEEHNGIVISFPAAKKLGVHIGDEVTLFIERKSLKNTVSLVVTGIFQDSSVFGMYTSYMDYSMFMKLMNYKDDVIDEITICYEKLPSEKEARRLHFELSKKYNMFKLVADKSEWQNYVNPDDQPLYALVPLAANISDLRKLSSALHAIVALIVLMLVVIICVGISSTFRVIVMKRSVESGTFRALGMKPSGLMMLYFTEVSVLLISGCLVGFALSLVVAKIAASFNLSFASGFDLFLTGGHLAPVLYGRKALFLVAAIFVTTLSAVLFTLRKLIHISPVGALSTVT